MFARANIPIDMVFTLDRKQSPDDAQHPECVSTLGGGQLITSPIKTGSGYNHQLFSDSNGPDNRAYCWRVFPFGLG